MARFICKNCGYRFESENQKKRCPYCSKEEVISKEQNAEEIISEFE